LVERPNKKNITAVLMLATQDIFIALIFVSSPVEKGKHQSV
jgi:hypothetical protein